jgi:hypothetical protein
MKEEGMQWENEKEEKKEALDSWIELTEEELGFAEAIHEILENSTTKEEFLRLAKALKIIPFLYNLLIST